MSPIGSLSPGAARDLVVQLRRNKERAAQAEQRVDRVEKQLAGMANAQQHQLQLLQQLTQRAEGPRSTIFDPVLPFENLLGGRGYVFTRMGVLPCIPEQLELGSQNAAAVGSAPASQSPPAPAMQPSSLSEAAAQEFGLPRGVRAIPALSMVGTWGGPVRADVSRLAAAAAAAA